MSFYDLVQSALNDTLGTSLRAFAPELAICATIVLLLLARMILSARSGGAFVLAFAGSLVALYLAAPWHYLEPGAALASGVQKATPIFTGMLVYDKFSVSMRGLLLVFAVLFAVFTRISRVPEDEEATEFFVLILGATLGMCLMVSANHMLIVFLGIEMASVPSYALAGLLKHRRQSSEAALKFAVFGGATAGVMLYGISLLAGALGSVHIPTMATQLAAIVDSGLGAERGLVLALGGLMVAVGLAFKLSAVPFHFWAPDVFEGATAEVGAFLSVASKAAALGLLARLAIAFSGVEGARLFLSGLIVLLAAVTCTFGNLAAYGQTNIKRLLAYSTIAHAGYMMMPMAAAVILAGTSRPDASWAVAAMVFYAAIYLFMNLGAFAAAAFLRNASGSELIDDYAGLVRRSPGVAVCFAIMLFSLVGLPPLAGFSAKFTIFAALYRADLLGLLAIGVVNTVLSLFYYLRIVRVMVLAPEPAGRPAARVPLWSASGLFCLAVAVTLGLLFVWWGPFDWAKTGTATLF
jgi:NADH-quinone oxidoreductase subunit N